MRILPMRACQDALRTVPPLDVMSLQRDASLPRISFRRHRRAATARRGCPRHDSRARPRSRVRRPAARCGIATIDANDAAPSVRPAPSTAWAASSSVRRRPADGVTPARSAGSSSGCRAPDEAVQRRADGNDRRTVSSYAIVIDRGFSNALACPRCHGALTAQSIELIARAGAPLSGHRRHPGDAARRSADALGGGARARSTTATLRLIRRTRRDGDRSASCQEAVACHRRTSASHLLDGCRAIRLPDCRFDAPAGTHVRSTSVVDWRPLVRQRRAQRVARRRHRSFAERHPGGAGVVARATGVQIALVLGDGATCRSRPSTFQMVHSY